MAIIQSILVGKGKGKIGNVVLSNLKGQTVAKQLNSSPSNPRTVAQTDNRVKMANAVLAWQFLSQFFEPAKGLRKPLESVYNAFVRTVKNGLSDILYSSRLLAAQAALSGDWFVGNWFTISVGELSTDALALEVSASGIAHSDNMHVRCIVSDNIAHEQRVVDRAVTLAEFTAGTITVEFAALANVSFGAAYIYDSASSKITNVTFES